MQQMNGKVALITGGSRGIGAAIARRLAAEGASLAVTYVSGEAQAQSVVDEIVSTGGRAMAIRADNRDDAALKAAVERTVAELGGLDILVNNAGIFLSGTIEEATLEELDRTIAINLRAPVVASMAVVGYLPEGGRIITIGSNLAVRVPWPGISLYAMSKAGLVGLTKGMARDLGPRGINVNIVHPGSTDTYYWQPTDPPFTTPRPPAERVALIEREIADHDSWVLAGSFCNWGDPLLHHFTLAIFLSLPHALRMQRLLDRERARYGDRIRPGGDMHDTHREFMEWARRYDTGKAPLRGVDLHERWLRQLACPVMRLDSRQPVEALCEAVLARLAQ